MARGSAGGKNARGIVLPLPRAGLDLDLAGHEVESDTIGPHIDRDTEDALQLFAADSLEPAPGAL
jgi:hypothetical protein